MCAWRRWPIVPCMSTDSHPSPIKAVSGVVWIWVESALVMTLGLIVVGGFFVLEGTWVRVVLALLLIAELVHLFLLHRRRDETAHDPRLREHRERRGF